MCERITPCMRVVTRLSIARLTRAYCSAAPLPAPERGQAAGRAMGALSGHWAAQWLHMQLTSARLTRHSSCPRPAEPTVQAAGALGVHLSLHHARTRTHRHAHARARAHTHTHTHTHTYKIHFTHQPQINSHAPNPPSPPSPPQPTARRCRRDRVQP